MAKYFHRSLKFSNEVKIRKCIHNGLELNHGFKAGRASLKFKPSLRLYLSFKMKYKLKTTFCIQFLISKSKTFDTLWLAESSLAYVKYYAISASVVIIGSAPACAKILINAH